MSLFMAIAEVLQYVPTFVGRSLRFWFYKLSLSSVGQGASFHLGSIVTDRRTKIGKNTRIGPMCSVGWAEIGNNVLLAQSVHVLSGRHQHIKGSMLNCIKVGNHCWLGAGSIIMASVEDKSIVGAGAVVTKTFLPDKVLVGNPAKPK